MFENVESIKMLLLAGDPVMLGNITIPALLLSDIKKISYKTYINYVFFSTSKMIDEVEKSNDDFGKMFEGLAKWEKFMLFSELQPYFCEQAKNGLAFFLGVPVYYNQLKKHYYFNTVDNELVLLNEEIWTNICNVIFLQNGDESSVKAVDSTVSEKTRKILAKIKKYRETIRKIKSQDAGEAVDFVDMIIAYCAKNTSGINIFNVWNMSLYAFLTQLTKLQEIDDYYFSYHALLAGAKEEEVNLRHWLNPIKQKEE